MTWWQAVVLGLVEGITEYLPVSSTGHLILASALLGLDTPAAKPAVDSFEIVIQGGAILAVVALYWPRIVQMTSGIVGRDSAGRRLVINLLIAFLPAALLGPLLDGVIDRRLFHASPVLAALFAGGVWMIWLDRRRMSAPPAATTITDLTWDRALAIGLCQCVALWPGTSRSMMTISGGLLLGLTPTAAAEFSFLLALPTLGSACLFKLAKDVLLAHRSGGENFIQALGPTPVVLGLVVATLSAMLAVRFLVGFLQRRGLAPFGWYRIALSVVLGAVIGAGLVQIG